MTGAQSARLHERLKNAQKAFAGNQLDLTTNAVTPLKNSGVAIEPIALQS